MLLLGVSARWTTATLKHGRRRPAFIAWYRSQAFAGDLSYPSTHVPMESQSLYPITKVKMISVSVSHLLPPPGAGQTARDLEQLTPLLTLRNCSTADSVLHQHAHPTVCSSWPCARQTGFCLRGVCPVMYHDSLPCMSCRV